MWCNSLESGMKKPNASSPNPSAKALEAAAMIKLESLVKGSEKKPSREAMQIAAKILAAKASKAL